METMKAIRMHSYGGADVLVYEDTPRPEPQPGEVLVQVYKGCYQRHRLENSLWGNYSEFLVFNCR